MVCIRQRTATAESQKRMTEIEKVRVEVVRKNEEGEVDFFHLQLVEFPFKHLYSFFLSLALV
jgi:hypothetical protein